MCNALVEGQYVTRKSWPEESGYLVFMPGMSSIWRITINPVPNAGNNLFSVEDFLADDWQVSRGPNKEIEDGNASDGANEGAANCT